MRVLVLGGSSEASALARLLADDRRFQATLSLAGATREPAPAPIPQRVGGFGGVMGLVAYLRAQHIDALIDATHPFARQMSTNAVAAAERTGAALLQLLRPPWIPVAGDRWIEVEDTHAAAEALGEEPQRVFLTIGRKDLAPFLAHPQHHYMIRTVDPPPDDLLPRDSEVITARGPFALADEQRLLAEHRIEILVTKNSGGSATAAKLQAARERGLPVVIVQRPELPLAERAPDPAAALAWLEALHAGTSAKRRGV
jgi:precorrin-6A/cobalt-precorrin-6A reductase